MSLEKDRRHSIWQDNFELPKFSALQDDLRADVCVVGGGMSGVSTAYQLGKRGYKVILLEAGRLGSGQSGRTTAHLTYQLEEQFCNLVKYHELDTLRRFAEAHRRAIDTIETNVRNENIDCEFRRLDGYLFLGPGDSLKTLREEVRIGNELGLDLELKEQIPGLPQLGPAVVFPRQGQFHPLKYMAGLISAMKNMDVAILEDSHVKEFHTHLGISRVMTDSGHEVEADYLVVATDSPVNNRFYIHTKQAAYRTYAVSFKTHNQVEIPLMWDTDDPYHYVRQSGDSVIIGGEDHRTGQPPETEPFAELEAWGRRNFPFLSEIEWQWSGQVFEPFDQLPFIGRNPGLEKNVFITTGASGIGMTTATIASIVITDLIQQKVNPWAEIFEPGRLAFSHGSEFLKENANIAIQYADWVKPPEVSAPQDIPDDSGCLMREGLHKQCVYHSEGEDYEKKSAVCTHLGGIVHWNDVEKTWDCPCHGSRFNAHGKVIEGPALSDLRGI